MMDSEKIKQKDNKQGDAPTTKKSLLFGRRPLYVKKTNLKKIKSINEKRNSASPKIATSTTSSHSMTVPVSRSESIYRGVSRESTKSNKSNRSSRGSAVSPFPKHTLMDGKDPGRVQVFVRLRPLNESEDLNKHPLAVTIADDENKQINLFDGKKDQLFQFDGVLPDHANNKEVYKNVAEPLVYSALSGFNGILMCYGQTGTGKTYSLMSNDGMSVRVMYQCFKVINCDQRHRYMVTCSYMQIYQEKIYDLLNETRTVELSLREHPKKGVYIENLTEYVVHSPEEVLNLLKVGRKRLVFAETKMNRVSSRSHAIIQLKILKERVGNDNPASRMASPSSYGMKTPDFYFSDDEESGHDSFAGSMNDTFETLRGDDDENEDVLGNLTDLEDGVTSVRGKIYICDLAGSERIKKTKASGERLSEAMHINSSLLELGNVIQALAEGNTHVPFRNSTLTRLLQEGLSGNCKTRLVVCVAPTVKDSHETKCSLLFGSRAMKVQVTAHVNYEVDYKKLAEALAAKLETLEQEWDIQKQEFISQLQGEIGHRRAISPNENTPSVKTDITQVRSLLVLELMTLQLFYNFQNHTQSHGTDDMMSTKAVLFSANNQDMMLRSMEGLLELLRDYVRDRAPARSSNKRNYSNQSSSGHSSVVTSPDYLDQGTPNDVMPNTLEPVASFLEHAQINKANSQETGTEKSFAQDTKTVSERLKRVVNTMIQLRETVNDKALRHLKDTFEASLQDSGKSIASLNTLDDVVSVLDQQKDLLSTFDSYDDVQSLESTLYYLLMDKSLLSSMILLRAQVGDLMEGWTSLPAGTGSDVKRLLEELTSERTARDKLQDELYSLQEESIMSEEKLKDVELELKAIRELKESLENKLHSFESKNETMGEQLSAMEREKDLLENRITEIDKKKEGLEACLKDSENNNARKERAMVDLKNEKVALDSLVATLKEEINMLEKERTRDVEDKRHIEEELEDLRDRNIILETEWSCCKEENSLLENELNALEEDKAYLEDEIGKYREDVKMLEEALSTLEAQAADYKKDIVALKNKEDRLIVSIRNEKDKFNKELNSLRQEMSTLRVERRRTQREISVSRADKSNTERAYNALKSQKDSLQDDVVSYKQEEKRLQREISSLKNDKAKLERDVNNLKSENIKLKNELQHVDKMKCDLKMLQKNEDRIASMFSIEKDRLVENLVHFKEKYNRMELDFNKICTEKDKLVKQLKRFENKHDESENSARRSQSQPTKASTPDNRTKNLKSAASMHGMLARRSVHSGEVSEVEGKVLDLQRRLAFFMAEKEDIQKELITTRERNTKLTDELKFLEDDTSKIQTLLSTLADEKSSLETKLNKASESRAILEKERDELKGVVTMAHKFTTELQHQLDSVTEQNRVLEVDHATLKESVNVLQNEAVILTNENKHIRMEFEKVDGDLNSTRSMVEEMNTKITDLKKKVKNANDNEFLLHDKLSNLETENVSLSQQVDVCHQEEDLLTKQLVFLHEKFNTLEKALHNIAENESDAEALEKVKELKMANSSLRSTINELKRELEAVVLDAECLKDEREEIEKLLQVDSKENLSQTGSLFDNICRLKTQVLKVKQEKIHIEEKMKLIEVQLISLGHKNETLEKDSVEKSSRLEQEKANYRQHIDKLQQQIEELVRERIQLEAEVEFLKKQNSELHRDIVIILDENSKLESELQDLEAEFGKQEQDLESATEETKLLLRQLCSAETQNLNLNMQQSTNQDDLERAQQQVQELQREKERLSEEHLSKDQQTKTLKDRLLMAELEISQLKSEHCMVESQRRTLARNLDAADQERALLKNELQGLARALSPLKKEVCEVVKKQHSLLDNNNNKDNVTDDRGCQDNNDEAVTEDNDDVIPKENEAGLDLPDEVNRMKEDLTSFNEEKSALEIEQGRLETRLKEIGDEKDDLRSKLRDLIQDLDESNKLASKENLSEMEDSIRMISSLMSDSETLDHEKVILSDDVTDAHYDNKILTIRVDNLNTELRSVQEDLSLATVDRLKLKDQWRQVKKHASHFYTNTEHNKGLKSLHRELDNLKTDLSSFEHEQKDLVSELANLNQQLVMAENNMANVSHFKHVIERHLRLYKDRNSRLESHLRVIHNDLIEMEAHRPKAPRKSAKVLLETINLHHYFSSLEDDLKNTEAQNKSLVEDQQDLKERCNALEQEKQVTTVSSEFIQDSMVGQHTFIAQLQKDKQTLAYEKERLQTKLSLFKDDKKRMLEDMQRLSRSLGATTRYNRELEAKLQSFKVDLSDFENRAHAHSDSRNGFDSIDGVAAKSTDYLCTMCREKVERKFLGISKNTQLLGDELLDCITDNLSLETAIFTFLEEKTYLEHEKYHLESDINHKYPSNNDHRDYVILQQNRRSRTYSSLSNHSEISNMTATTNQQLTPRQWSGSQLSIDSDISTVKRMTPPIFEPIPRHRAMTTPLRRTSDSDDEIVRPKPRPNSCVGIYTINFPTSTLVRSNTTTSVTTPQVARLMAMSSSSSRLSRKYRIAEQERSAVKRTRRPLALRMRRYRDLLVFGNCAGKTRK
ncbi:kinesin-like protein KIF15 isoform X3 [Clytia hemisphaerica]|uniref:kinesin-like protein KIF15 isoform X3 n=1 Tax=Clytia hemisphaerica TaxID=252671 RepID=UPI0034D4D9D1